jgi:hypothetical protein
MMGQRLTTASLTLPDDTVGTYVGLRTANIARIPINRRKEVIRRS